MGRRRAVVPAWSAVVTKWPFSRQPLSPNRSIGLCLKGSRVRMTAHVGIQPATQTTSASKSRPCNAAIAASDIAPAGSSFTTGASNTSSPRLRSSSAAAALLSLMNSGGVFTSPKPIKPTLAFFVFMFAPLSGGVKYIMGLILFFSTKPPIQNAPWLGTCRIRHSAQAHIRLLRRASPSLWRGWWDCRRHRRCSRA